MKVLLGLCFIAVVILYFTIFIVAIFFLFLVAAGKFLISKE